MSFKIYNSNIDKLVKNEKYLITNKPKGGQYRIYDSYTNFPLKDQKTINKGVDFRISDSMRSFQQPTYIEYDDSTTSLYSVQATKNGKYIVYVAVKSSQYYLYSVPIDNSTKPVQLNTTTSVINNVKLSDDSKYVVYHIGVDLYSAVINSDSSELLLNATPGVSSVFYYIFSDSLKVCYLSSSNVYITDINSSTETKFNITGSITAIYLSANDEYIVYKDATNLYSTPTAGPGELQINVNGPPTLLEISKDSTKVAYSNGTNIYTTGIAVQSEVKLNTVTSVSLKAISDDSNYVVYSNSTNLYSSPIGSSGELKINDAGTGVNNVVISPDSKKVTWNTSNNVYSTDIYAQNEIKLNGTSGSISLKPQISKDSKYVGYEIGNILYTNLIGGSSEKQFFPAGDTLYIFNITNDSKRILYWTKKSGESLRYLYSSAIGDKGVVESLSPEGAKTYSNISILEDDSKIAYSLDTNGKYTLVSTPTRYI